MKILKNLVFFLFFFTVQCFEGILDNSLYTINWHDSFVQQTTDRMSMMVTTNNNEKYQCLLPKISSQSNKLHEEQMSEEKLELEFLKAQLESNICAYKAETYWTYEVCHGKSVRQFHEHFKPPSTQEYFLGYYSKEKFDADLTKDRVERQLGTSTRKTKTKKVYGTELPYYEVTYTDGTLCDLTDKFRKTHVQYVCDESSHGELYDIKETSSCEYEAVVLTKYLCSHPKYGKRKDSIHGIDCHPLASSPTRPLNYRLLVEESIRDRAHPSKSRLVDSLWDVVFSLADEEDEEEIHKIAAKTLGIGLDSVAEKQQHQQQQQATTQQATEEHQATTQQTTQQQQLPDLAYKEILHSFLSGAQCITGGSGWWKHEVCYKGSVKQFHLTSEGGREEVLLGEWSEEEHLKWVQTASKKAKNDKGRKYVYNYYSNGDYCDEIKERRAVQVRLECLDSSTASKGILIHLIEPSVCSYELVVQSYIFCAVIDSAHENGLITYP